MTHADELRTTVRECAWLMDVLTLVCDLHLPDCYVGAGAVRDVVFDERFGSAAG